MRKAFIPFAAVIALLLASAAPVAAQTTTAPAAYTGPRYPGGPDSLRALVQRSTRLTMSAPTGRMLVQFELKPDGKTHNLTMVRPPEPLNPPLVKATATALNYLEVHMLPWQLGSTRVKDVAGNPPKISLVMDFTTPPTALPYSYGDSQPVFTTVIEAMRTRFSKMQPPLEDSVQQALFASTSRTLISHLQREVKYPLNALRYREEGRAYVYFEVTESGAIEDR